MRNFFMALIVFYQRFMSPYKGFSCAHRVVNNGMSCSEAVRLIVAEHGVISGIPLMRQRFRSCHLAYRSLQDRKPEKDRKHRPYRCWMSEADCAECCFLPFFN